MANASRDENSIPTMLAVSNADNTTPVKLWADPTTHRLLVDLSGSGMGDVTKVGTPVDNQVGVWTGDGTLEGDADLTFDGTRLATTNLTVATTGTASIADAAIDVFGTTNAIFHAHNVGAQGDSAGSAIIGYALPLGAAIDSGSRLAAFVSGGSNDISGTLVNATAMTSFATEDWDGTQNGANIKFEVTPNGATTRSVSLTLDQDLSATFAGNVSATGTTLSGLTASEIVITDGSKNLASAPVATYPSLTELTYVKGVTSAIQTQLNSKGNVSKVGTPVDNQVGVWTGDGTLEGTTGLTYSGTKLDVDGSVESDMIGVGKAGSASIRLELLTNGTYTQGARVEGDVATRLGFSGYVTGDAQVRYTQRVDGMMAWGDGSSVADTNLYRSAANTLKTDDSFVAGAGLTVAALTGVLRADSGVVSVDSNIPVSSINFVIDGGGSAITTGVKGFIEIPFACTINQVTMLADQSGSIVVDIWKDVYASYPPTDADSITASAPPTITTATKSQDATLTGWTTSVSAGDILGFNVDSATTVQRVTIALKVTRT